MADCQTLFSLSTWVPALGTATAFAVVVWLARNLIVNRLTKSVQYEFDAKLAVIQSTLREREVELSSVRQTVLSAITSNRGIVDERKLQATDHLWEGLLSARKLLWAVHAVSTLNIDAISKQLQNPGMQAFVEAITKPLDSTALTGTAVWNAQKSQPWVSPMAWALYTAYSVVMGYAHLILIGLKSGVPNPQSYMSREKMIEMLRTALPDLKLDWDKLSDVQLPNVLEALELRLLREIQDFISGHQLDADTLDRARRITSLALDLQSAEKTAQVPKAP